jgi:RND family efflux transporter MFP subunit
MKSVNINFRSFLLQIPDSQRILKFLIPLILIVLSAYLAGCQQSQGKENTENAPPPMQVPVANPIQKEITEWDEYTGRFRAVEKVEVRARVSGYIDAIKFKDGEMVQASDVLFIIDQRPFQITLQQAQAQLEQAKAEHQQAQSAFSRVATLKDSKAISEEEFDQRQQALYVASAKIKAAEANVDRAKLDLQFTVVKAPISGRVSEDFVNVGNLISGGSDQGTLLTTIVSLDPIYFYFEGSESAFLKYNRQTGKGTGAGQSAHHVLAKMINEEDFLHEGQMDFIDNEVDLSTGTFQGRAIFSNPGHTIEPGMFGTIRVEHTDKHDAILIPDALIATDQSMKVVFVLGDSNKVEAKPVQLGALHTSELRIVESGLSLDDQIIIGNIQKIYPGMIVQPEVKKIAENQLN